MAGKKSTIEPPEMVVLGDGSVLIDVKHGSRLARAWLAGFAAHDTALVENAPVYPALFRTLLVEGFRTGYRFTSTDAFWVATAWVGNPVDPDVGPTDIDYEVEKMPVRGERPLWTCSVVDGDYRIRDLMKWVRARTKKVSIERPDTPLRISLRKEHDDDTPRLDPLFDQVLVDAAIPGIELVTGHVNELAYPDVAQIAWANDKADAVALDHVQLNPRLLRNLGAAVAAVDAESCRFHFHGDPTKPVSWEAVGSASADLYGLLMPQRTSEDD